MSKPFIHIRKSGPDGWPWRVRCSKCPIRRPITILVPGRGGAVINDLGIGNRSWEMAMAAADIHAKRHQVRSIAATSLSQKGFGS